MEKQIGSYNAEELMYIVSDKKATCITGNIPLEDGVYEGYFYSWILEIEEQKYPTLFGVRCTKDFCGGLKEFRVVDKKTYIIKQ